MQVQASKVATTPTSEVAQTSPGPKEEVSTDPHDMEFLKLIPLESTPSKLPPTFEKKSEKLTEDPQLQNLREELEQVKREGKRKNGKG